MNERAFTILCLLAGNNDKFEDAVDNALSAVTIQNILDCNEELLDNESAIYRNLQYLRNMGFVKFGIRKGRAYTYYISSKGLEYLAQI